MATGNAGGDSFGRYHSGQQFTTIDRDNDAQTSFNCAAARIGGFWWRNCGVFTPNGGYYYHGGRAYGYTGLHWSAWRGDYSLKAVQMAFRATN